MGDYPTNLGKRIKTLNNFSANTIKLTPSNSQTETQNIKSSGARLEFTLPPNSLLDLSTFSVFSDYSTVRGSTHADGDSRFILARYANSLISRLTVEVGGQVVSDISEYGRLNSIFMDYQFGIEGGSKKLCQNIDPLKRVNKANGANLGIVATAQNNAAATDAQKLVFDQFLGLMSGHVSHIDTGIVGNIKVTIYLEQPSKVLFKSGAFNAAAASANVAADVALAEYSLDNVYATIRKISIDDGIYYQSVSTALSSGIPFAIKYNDFTESKSGSTNGNITVRAEVMSNSVDMVLLSFYPQDGHVMGKLPDEAQIGTERTKTAKELATEGKVNCFTSNYFKRVGTDLTSTQFFLNNEPIPLNAMKNEQVFKQSLIDFNIHDDTDNGIYYGINSLESWNDNYWLATCSLSALVEDSSWKSGFNCTGVNATLSAETTSSHGNPDYIAQMYVMTSRELQAFAGRQINIVR